MEPKKKHTPRARRDRKTKASVWITEVLAKGIISAGGIGTIVAVVTVCVFLVWVAAPLFFSATVEGEHKTEINWSKSSPVQLGMDEDQLMCWALFPDGSLQLIRMDTGELLKKQVLFENKKLTSVSFTAGGEESVFGFADGSVQMGKIRFKTSFVQDKDLPENLKHLTAAKAGTTARFNDGVVIRTPQDQNRLQELIVDLKKPADADEPVPVLLIDQSKTTTGQVIAAMTSDGKLRLNSIQEKENFGTGEITYFLTGSDLPYQEPAGKGPPLQLCTSAEGDQIFLFWKDGHLVRIDARDKEKPVVAETINVLEDSSLHVTVVRSLIGKGTILVGDSSGRVRAWFYTPSNDGGKMVCGHDLPGPNSSVVSLAVSDRSRLTAVAYANGKARLIYVTSERVMTEFDLEGQQPSNIVLAPKDDGMAVSSAKGLWQWSFDKGHPEVTPKVLFSKVWYETYPRPEFVWQSSGGTTGFEPKFSLIPLIFGTLKASFYSLLFGVPLALLAAIYTSEFLSPRVKIVVKPSIELMASLPSVVLGFLAGLVFAQFVEGIVPAVIACMFTIPLSFLLGAYLWQLAPDKVTQVLAKWRFGFICLVLPIGLMMAMPAGLLMETLLFAGSIRGWLAGHEGSPVGGWLLLMLPLSAILSLILVVRFVNPWIRSRTVDMSRFAIGFVDLIKFLVGCVFTVGIAWIIGLMLSAIGWDPRGPLVGPYSQRNALVVGFIMGFAIIPIIYTIAEDALSAVPEHLRAGSLAAGATQWQTAVRIIIPTAMSGLFSAVMIGLGRAVGETMIVLMATGNTPVMEWSIFNGFRTLSANIAVELPEAVRDSTHYRTLFLAALTLFVITFVLNTFAEIVRLRFRRRAYQL